MQNITDLNGLTHLHKHLKKINDRKHNHRAQKLPEQW